MAGELASIEACIPALRRYATVLVRSPQDADDLVHDTLVRALDKLHARHDDAEVRPWLFAIMHNLFVSQMRWAKVRHHSSSPIDVEATAVPVRERQEEDAPRWQDVMQAFNTLPQDQRVVLLLVSIETFSYAEVARVLGIPLGTVMSRLARGRECLRNLTQGDGDGRFCLSSTLAIYVA
jgi:RNA polymerase sigma factor (sigma-70 family)